MKTKFKCLQLLLIFQSSVLIGQISPELIEKAMASVVTVAVYKTAPIGKKILGTRGFVSNEAYQKSLDLTDAKGSGSGFVVEYKSKKYIITNAHVIESASDEEGSLYVYSISRKKYEVRVVGGDNFYDIAILEFKSNPGDELKTINFSNSDIKIGEQVYAIGNPLGEFPYSVTDGIISAKNRIRGGVTGKFGYLQTTATLIWGNSGGPLINTKGDVVGVNSQIHFATTPSGEQIIQSQLNFSLESEITKRIIKDVLENKGVVKRLYSGIEFSEQYIIEENYDGSNKVVKSSNKPIISGVLQESPNYQFSKYLNYKVTHINDNEINNLEDILGEMEQHIFGSKLKITLENENGEKKELTLNTIPLGKEELENIAKWVLKENTELELEQNNQQVSVKFRSAKSNKNTYMYKKINRYEKYNENSVSNYNGYMIAAGTFDTNSSNLWRITTLSDLGSSLRIMGLRGVFDYCISLENSSEPVVFRQYFSGSERILQKKLWY